MLNRRTFILNSGFLFFPSFKSFFPSFFKTQNIVVAAAHFTRPLDQNKYCFAKINLSSGSLETLPLKFEGHGIYFQNSNPQRCLLTGKKGNGSSALIDVKEMREVSSIKSQPDFYFYGHSCQDQHGNWYIVEENSIKNTSLISIWSRNLKDQLGIIELEGSGAHDIQFIPEREAILVGVSNRKTSYPSQLQLIDIKNKKVIHRIFSHSQNASIDHFQVRNQQVYVGLRNKEISLATTALLGTCSLDEEKLNPFYIPGDLKLKLHKNALSVVLDSEGRKLWLSTTGAQEKSGNILTWDLKSKNFLAAYPSKESLGIDQIEKNTIAVSANEGKILVLKDNKLEKRLDFSNQINVLGAHLYKYKV